MHKNTFYDVIIIGAGPAGLFAAANLRKDISALLLEKNASAGKKLLMAGSGRCNITHTGDIENFFRHYGDNINFLKPALKEFTNTNLINFLKEGGIDIFIDKNDKVFPESEQSRDVLAYLLKIREESKISIIYDEPVLSIKKAGDIFVTGAEKNTYKSKSVIISTGGKSYPTTGSTGDGYKLAEMMSHSVIPVKPALTPVTIKNYRFAALSGVSLSARELNLYRNNKKIKRHVGDIGFTHTGLSGPGILDFSRYFEVGDVLSINLINSKPDDVRNDFIKTAQIDGSDSLKKFFKFYEIPESLIDETMLEVPINSTTKLSRVDKQSRNKIIDLFCGFPFEIERLGDFNIAMVTKGGVNLQEVNPKTMESRIIPNLYFAGEVLDIDGDTGGYNLQAAFSTAYMASKSINQLYGDNNFAANISRSCR
jgi:hypothetical protein